MRKSLVLVLGLGVAAVAATLLAQTLPPVYFNHITIFLSPKRTPLFFNPHF
jgi:hypothetical protein